MSCLPWEQGLSPFLSGSAGSLHFSIENYFFNPWSMTTAHKPKCGTAVMKSAPHLFPAAILFSHLEAIAVKSFWFLFTCLVYLQSSVIHLLQRMVSKRQRLFPQIKEIRQKWQYTAHSCASLPAIWYTTYKKHTIFGHRIEIENNQSWSKCAK